MDAALAGQDRVITPDHLPDDFLVDARRCPVPGPAPGGMAPAAAAVAAATPAGASLKDLELQAIKQAVAAAGGNISEAAKQLGVSRNTIYRKLRWKESASS